VYGLEEQPIGVLSLLGVAGGLRAVSVTVAGGLVIRAGARAGAALAIQMVKTLQ